MAQRPPKYSLDELIVKMQPEHQRVCCMVVEDYSATIYHIPGSSHNHQTWEGGYIAHIEEAMNIGLMLYDELNARRPLPFGLSEVLFCIFLHDFDKLQRYEHKDGKFHSKGGYSTDFHEKTKSIIAEKYSYKLTPEEDNALKYAHGEGDDYQSTKRTMLPLATMVHCSDTISARIWFDEGHEHDRW